MYNTYPFITYYSAGYMPYGFHYYPAYFPSIQSTVSTTYYPLCGGSGTFPPIYQSLGSSAEIIENMNTLVLLWLLSQYKILPYLFDESALRQQINALTFSSVSSSPPPIPPRPPWMVELEEGGESSPDFQRDKLIEWLDQYYSRSVSLVNDTLSILASFHAPISPTQFLTQLQNKLSTKPISPDFWDDPLENSPYAQMYLDLLNVFQLETSHTRWAEKSRNRKQPDLAECGLIIASNNDQFIGSIWVFSDPRMVSTDGRVRYIFAQGIRNSLPYMLARQVAPTIVPAVSEILIQAVETWAHQQNANAIRINPLKVMYEILTQKLGFTRIDEATAREISPFLFELSDFISIYRVIKYLS